MWSVVWTGSYPTDTVTLYISACTDDNDYIQRHKQRTAHILKISISFMHWNFPQVTSIKDKRNLLGLVEVGGYIVKYMQVDRMYYFCSVARTDNDLS